jgi:hypothetical protein
MAVQFFKAPPEAEAPVAWPVPAEEGQESSLSVYILDRAGDPDGNAGGFDWYAAVGDQAAIDDWADEQPLEPTSVEDLPNPLANCPAELAEHLPEQVPPPDYLAFWDALLVSPIYQEIRTQALTNPGVLVACTEFVAAFADAKSGWPNVPAIQACINYLMAAGEFSAEHLAGLGELLGACHLAHLFTLPSAS